MRTHKLALAALAAAALALAAAGCGGDSDESSGPPLTKEEFIAQADQICLEGDNEINAAVTERFGSSQQEPPVEDQRDFISTVVADSFESQLNQIRELNPPEADADQVNEILDELERLVDTARNDPDALISGEVDNNADELAQEYGFTNCGS